MHILSRGLYINNIFIIQIEIAINDLLKLKPKVFLDFKILDYKGYDFGNSSKCILS